METQWQFGKAGFKAQLWLCLLACLFMSETIGPTKRPLPVYEPEVALVSKGKFVMGNDKGAQVEAPAHEVLVRTFYMGKYEVTNKEWVSFLNSEKNEIELNDKKEIIYKGLKIGSLNCEHACLSWEPEISYQDGNFKVAAGREDYPAVLVSWFGAQKYADWLARVTGRPYRLPTEEEWEYAAGEGKRHLKWAGVSKASRLSEYANLCDRNCVVEDWRNEKLKDPYPERAPVGSFKPNAFGIYDMTGNVSEWCGESFYLYTTQKEGSLVIPNPYEHTIRGGSWINSPKGATTTLRVRSLAEQCDVTVGFRLARGLEESLNVITKRESVQADIR